MREINHTQRKEEEEEEKQQRVKKIILTWFHDWIRVRKKIENYYELCGFGESELKTQKAVGKINLKIIQLSEVFFFSSSKFSLLSMVLSNNTQNETRAKWRRTRRGELNKQGRTTQIFLPHQNQKNLKIFNLHNFSLQLWMTEQQQQHRI
jgi:hypothetical protein